LLTSIRRALDHEKIPAFFHDTHGAAARQGHAADLDAIQSAAIHQN